MGSSDKLQFSGCWLLTALLPRGGEIHSCADFPSPVAPESGFAELRRGIPATVSLVLAAAQSRLEQSACTVIGVWTVPAVESTFIFSFTDHPAKAMCVLPFIML